MKYIISESKLKPIIKRFLKSNLGEFIKEPLQYRRDLGYWGDFVKYDKVVGIVGSGTLRLDLNLFVTMSKMFNMDIDNLDPYIIELVNEIISPYKIHRVTFLV